MKQNKNLSLKEEVEKEARKIEQEILSNPDLEDVKVSDKMESALLAEIQSYERKRAMIREKVNEVEENTTEESSVVSTEDTPNFSGRTNDGKVIYLSEEDLEALRIGRQLLKKDVRDDIYKVNAVYRKHLKSDMEKKEGRNNTGEKAKVFRKPRKKRVIVAFLAVCVLVVATGVTSVGSKSYLKVLWEKLQGDQAMEVTNIKDMDTKNSEDGDEVTAYRKIRNDLGVIAIRIGAKPKDMHLVEYKIDEEQERAQLFYKYGGDVMRYTIYLNDSDSSLVQKKEDVLVDEFKVESSKQSIKVKKYKKSNAFRYVANFEYLGVYYQVKGVMKEEEFIDILENLIYFE